MKNYPDPENQLQPSSSRHLCNLLLSRTGLALGFLLLVGLAGSAWWLWIFINQQLAPLVEKNLTQTLNRPVQLGQVKRFSLTSLRFGESSVPATPTDPSRVSVDAIDVVFDPLQLVLTRTLKLDITLVNPNVFIEQDKKGDWISPTLAAEEALGPIKTDLGRIRVRNADVVLIPKRLRTKEKGKRSKENIFHSLPVAVTQVNGVAQVLEDNQLIRFDLGGQFATGGTIAIQGESHLTTAETNLQLQGQKLPLSEIARLIELPLEIQAGQVDSNLKIQLRKFQDLRVFGTAGLKAVQTKINQLPKPFIISQGTLSFQGTGVQLEKVAASYGKISAIANGSIDPVAGYKVSALVKAASLASVQQSLKLELPVPITAEVRAEAQLTGSITQPILSGIFATTKLARLDRVNFSKISSRFAFSTATSEITFKDIQATPLLGGQITGSGKIRLGQKTSLGFDVVAKKLPGDAIARIYSVPTSNIKIGTVQAQAKISGTATNPQTLVNWQATQATYPAQGKITIAGTNTLLHDTVVNVAGGTIQANGQLTNSRWLAQLQANNVQLKRLAQVPPQLQGRLTGKLNVSGTTAAFQPETLRAEGRASVTGLAGDTITVSNIQLNQGRWQSIVSASQVQLKQFSKQLRGSFSGQLFVTGTVKSFSPAAIRATGDVRFSQGLALISQPLTAKVQWDGQKVIVEQAKALGLNASGSIFTKVAGTSVPVITSVNLSVQAQNYNLQDLPFQLPFVAVNLAGRANFAGRVSGNLSAPNVEGSVQLRNFAVNNLAFEPFLTGNVRVVARRGVQFEVTGAGDRIALNLDPNYRPTSFVIRRDQALATGQTQGENLLVKVKNFPLPALTLTPPNPVFIGPVAGVLTADLEINPATYVLEGNIAISNPAIGLLKGDAFVAQFRYVDGVGTYTQGEFVQGESRYALSGNTQTSSGLNFVGQVNVIQGRVQDILTALQIFDWQDFQRGLQPSTFADASDLNLASVGFSQAPLLQQLRRFSEIQALLQQQRQQSQNTLPQLSELEGTFSGKISLSASLQTGLTAKFELEGKNWEWDSYTAERVIASGSFENGIFTLVPVKIESEDTLLTLNGQIGSKQQSGQLQIKNFPVEVLNNFVALPVELAGELNATATLAGSLENPQAVGELQLADGTLNQKPISATASFSYNDARLTFNSNVAVLGLEPIQIIGSVPAALPLTTVMPDSNEIRLDVSLQNEELALLNLLNNSFAWEQGSGKVQLQVRGTTKQPTVTGIATVNNATITAQVLPEPLTDVTGKILFDVDRIQVEGVSGNFSRGNVQVRGIIPLFASWNGEDPNYANPLTVTLDQLKLNLKGVYEGGASGNLVITGSALSPIVSGEVRLDQGNVSLSEPPESTVPQFNNLQIRLGDRIEIARPPIFNFHTTGTVTLNGTLKDLSPSGVVQIDRGIVNLFSTQFILTRDDEHTATFSPNQGLDPTLAVRLITVVPEVTSRRIPNSPGSAEITEAISTNVGTLETVRIQATVRGRASQIVDNLELTSNPSRSQSEIIALLGGSFVQTLGLTNLAGSALLRNFQGTVTNIGNAIGVSELRLFPTFITSEESQAATLGLAAEVGIDISPNVFASVIQVLAANQYTQFGLSYRINNSLRLRAATDFFGESRAVVEYENQF